KLVRTLIADVVASDEVAAGVREELARAGMLEGGDGYPRVEIEVLRASDTGDLRAAETIAVDEGPAGPDPRASAFHEADALRAAARRLGRTLAYKVTGEPGASDDGSE